MKRTHKAILKMLKVDDMTLAGIVYQLKRLYSQYPHSMSSYNINLALWKLESLGYVTSTFVNDKRWWKLTGKGREYLARESGEV